VKWDSVHSIEVTLRVSAGGRIGVHVAPGFSDFRSVEALVEDPYAFTYTELEPGPRTQTVSIPIVLGFIPAPEARQLFLRPTDVDGAEFAIESVRMVFRTEHLGSLPSGLGRHAMAEVYRPSLLVRSGEEIQLDVEVPADGRLDVAVGTTAQGATQFRVDLTSGNTRNHRILQHTVTTPNRWERVTADLSSYAGQLAILRFSQHSHDPYGVGLIGSPSIRSHGGFHPERPKSVIVIAVDSLRRDRLGVYGHGRDTAPWIKRIADEGMFFRDAIASSSWGVESLPSILTGLFPGTHGVRGLADRLPASAVTLAERFREAGYTTVGYSSDPLLGRFSNLQQGFDSFHEASSLSSDSTETATKTAREIVDRLIDWLRQHRDEPTFAFLHVRDPHDPYQARMPYAATWVNLERRALHLEELERVRPFIESQEMRRRGLATASELRAAGIDPIHHGRLHLDWYDGSIRAMDSELARIGEALRDLAMHDDAIIVLTGDHGEQFHEHGGVSHGSSLYAEEVQVPMIFWAPSRIRPGVVVTHTVQSVDIAPTLLRLASIPIHAGMQGRTLVPWIEDPPDDDVAGRPAYAQLAAQRGPHRARRGESDSMVTRRWRLIRNVRGPDGGTEGMPEFELFDRDADPSDRLNVADSHPDVLQDLSAKLEAWRANVAAQTLVPDVDPASTLTRGELERMRALGYAE
jgi:arylsulfatase A-like enzyme